MGCVSSKLLAKEIRQENLLNNRDCAHHVVSLTSTTYGLLKLDKEQDEHHKKQECPMKEMKKASPSREETPPEIINAWELMEGLEVEEEVTVGVPQSKIRSPKSRVLIDPRSPLKLLNQIGSPRKVKKIGGKENSPKIGGIRSAENSPKTVLKDCSNLKKPSPRLWASMKGSPNVKRCDSLRVDSGVILPRTGRRSLGPLFDPENTELTISPNPNSWKARKSKDAGAVLELYTKKCPPGGENAVIIYTTTLRGIRKTFEDCNIARSIVKSQNVEMIERDISMHSGFKEELRELMESKEVKVPVVFVKGRLIGGAEEMMTLDEEGELGSLFDGISEAQEGCGRCGGIRFVMCMVCNGSCKVLGEDGKKSAKCNECNENGLMHCPVCCC